MHRRSHGTCRCPYWPRWISIRSAFRLAAAWVPTSRPREVIVALRPPLGVGYLINRRENFNASRCWRLLTTYVVLPYPPPNHLTWFVLLDFQKRPWITSMYKVWAQPCSWCSIMMGMRSRQGVMRLSYGIPWLLLFTTGPPFTQYVRLSVAFWPPDACLWKMEADLCRRKRNMTDKRTDRQAVKHNYASDLPPPHCYRVTRVCRRATDRATRIEFRTPKPDFQMHSPQRFLR